MNITGINQDDLDTVINEPNSFGQLQTDLVRSTIDLTTINFQINPPNYNFDDSFLASAPPSAASSPSPPPPTQHLAMISSSPRFHIGSTLGYIRFEPASTY